MESWEPTLADVARHIPTRTRDNSRPGQDLLLNTFTDDTTPTAGQAQDTVDTVVSSITAMVGDVPATADPLALARVQAAARHAAEWRAAADIELAYPQRDADVRVYQQLDARAQLALADLRGALEALGAGVVDVMPVWGAPAPPAWADQPLY